MARLTEVTGLFPVDTKQLNGSLDGVEGEGSERHGLTTDAINLGTTNSSTLLEASQIDSY